jgi:hypothetical protein
MKIDLNQPLKVTGESERTVAPAETVERALSAADRSGIALEARVADVDVFHALHALIETRYACPPK